MLKNELLKALQFDANGDWDASHRIVQQYFSAEACWIHSYLYQLGIKTPCICIQKQIVMCDTHNFIFC